MNRLHPSPADVLARMAAQRKPRPAIDTPFASPDDADERILADCWAEVLELQEVGADDNFFHLGGDSLHMTRIASRVRERCGVELPMTQFFTDPTIAALAKFVRSERERESVGSDRSDGLVISATPRVTAATRPQPSVVSDGLITTVSIATAGRPAALERCLAGLTRMLRHYLRAPRILIIDGSEDASTAAANRAIVDRATQAYGGTIALADRNAMQSFAARLVEAGFEKDLISFSLPGTDEFRLGSRLGASRNLQLLASNGEAFLSLDDDTDCRFTPSRQLDERAIDVDLRGDDPAQIWGYPDRTTLLSKLTFGDFDLLAGHERLLGRAVDELQPAATDLGRRRADDASFHPNAAACVRVTLGGLVGDCGWGTPSRYLFIDDASFRRLSESDDVYRAGVASRDMLQVAANWSVSGRVDNLIAATFAADGRTTLPPFPPVGRGSDVVFGRLLKTTQPEAAFGHVPWAILHEPVQARHFSPGEIVRSAATTDVKGMFCALLADIAASDPRISLASIGQRLIEIGTRSVADFQHHVVTCRRVQIDHEISFLTARRQSVPSSSAPQRDLDAYLQSLRRSRDQPTSAIPAECLYGREVPIAAHLARRIVTQFGHLVCAWPDLIAETRRHHRAGTGAFSSLEFAS